MATTQIQKDLESGNAAYAASFTAGDLPLPPSKHYVVVTCMVCLVLLVDANFSLEVLKLVAV